MTGLLASEEGERVDFSRLRHERRRRLFEAMGDDDLDALILGRPGNVRYASGARQLWTAGIRPFAPACVAVRASGAVHLLSVWNEGVPPEIPTDHLFGLSWNPARLMQSLAAITGMSEARRIGTDGLTPLFRELFSATWPAARFVDGRPALWRARRTKTPDEVHCLRTAAAAAEAGLSAVLDALTSQPAATERELTGVFAERVASLGTPVMASQSVACATEQLGPVILRGAPTDRTVLPGQLVVVDAGVLYAGYEASLARTWPAGTAGTARDGEAPRPHRALAARCWRALDALLEQCQAGRSGADLASAWQATGEPGPSIPLAYGLGLGAEPPVIALDRGHEAVLQTGDVLAVQAWVHEEGVGGVLARDAVLVRGGAPERLTRFDRARL